MTLGNPGIQIVHPRGRAAVVHINDSFTGADGTNLNGWTPDVENTPGNTWSAVLQNWSIVSECARGTNYLFSLLVIESGVSDCVLTMPVTRGGNQNGIVFRYIDNSNYWYATLSSVDGFAIMEVNGGVKTKRSGLSITMSALETMTVTLSGNSISVNWNGSDLSYNSALHATATKHGIMRQDWVNNGTADWWDLTG